MISKDAQMHRVTKHTRSGARQQPTGGLYSHALRTTGSASEAKDGCGAEK